MVELCIVVIEKFKEFDSLSWYSSYYKAFAVVAVLDSNFVGTDSDMYLSAVAVGQEFV